MIYRKKQAFVRETESSLREKIKSRNEDGLSFRILAGEFDTVTHGDLCRIANGHPFPKNPNKRRELGLSALVEVPRCPRCNGVHTRKCSERKTIQRRPISLQDKATIIAYIRFLRNKESLKMKASS